MSVVCMTQMPSVEHRATLSLNHPHAVRMNPLATVPDKSGISHLALQNAFLWENGHHLRVKFLNGNAYQHSMAQQNARRWLHHANLTMEFVTHGDAEIRVTFNYNGGHWSQVGTSCLNEWYNQNVATMNLDPSDLRNEDDYERVVVHEFGHALGCIHEHQSPSAGIQWNKSVVLAYYAQRGWGPLMVQHNVFDVYNRSMTNFSAFDRWSIMLYPIPYGHAYNITTGWNRTLSETDKKFIAKIYPKPSVVIPPPPPPPPTSGENIHWRDREGNTLLHLACKSGDENRVRALLKQGSDKEAREYNWGYTPLHMATWYRHNRVVLLLLLYGANVSAKTNAGLTPLKMAQMWKDKEIQQLLTSNGAVA